MCGATFGNDGVEANGLCLRCAGYDVGQPPGLALADASADVSVARVIDPDHPHWGAATGIGVWVASVAAIIVIPIIAVIAWYVLQKARHAPVPSLSSKDEMLEWLKSPNLLLVQVLSTILAHALTIAVCWAVVTRLGTRPFWESLGWNWAGRSVWYTALAPEEDSVT